MIKRLFVLVLCIAVGIVLSQNLDVHSSWQKAQAFLEKNSEGELLEKFLEKTKKGNLEQEVVYLEKKLQQLKSDLLEAGEDGGRRFEKLESAVMRTTHALVETKHALGNLGVAAGVSSNSGGGSDAYPGSGGDNPGFAKPGLTEQGWTDQEIESFCGEFD